MAAVRTGKIDIVGHPDDEKYPLFAEELVRACADANTMIELNNASLTPGGYRGNAKERDAELLALCEKHKVVVAMGSDSHGAAHVGNFTYAEALIRECCFSRKFTRQRERSAFLFDIEKPSQTLKRSPHFGLSEILFPDFISSPRTVVYRTGAAYILINSKNPE